MEISKTFNVLINCPFISKHLMAKNFELSRIEKLYTRLDALVNYEKKLSE